MFFQSKDFHPGYSGGLEVVAPPIIGEPVNVVYSPTDEQDRPPRARSVRRVEPPVLLEGVVDTFNPKKGWGFALTPDGVSYYLHRSEVLGGSLPLPGDKVFFYGGWKKGRPRACYVRVQR